METILDYLRYRVWWEAVLTVALLLVVVIGLLWALAHAPPCLGELRRVGSIPVTIKTGQYTTIIVDNPVYKCID